MKIKQKCVHCAKTQILIFPCLILKSCYFYDYLSLTCVKFLVAKLFIRVVIRTVLIIDCTEEISAYCSFLSLEPRFRSLVCHRRYVHVLLAPTVVILKPFVHPKRKTWNNPAPNQILANYLKWGKLLFWIFINRTKRIRCLGKFNEC